MNNLVFSRPGYQAGYSPEATAEILKEKGLFFPWIFLCLSKIFTDVHEQKHDKSLPVINLSIILTEFLGQVF